MTRLRIFSLLLVFTLCASACGGADGTDTAVDTAEATDTPEATANASIGDTEDSDDTDDTADQPTANSGGDDDSASAEGDSDSPIENLLGVPIFDQAAMSTLITDLSREAEVVMARCMLAQGFDYTPELIGGEGQFAELVPDSLEYAEQRGLGIVVEFNEAEYNPATAKPNANNEYVAGLGESERDAYFLALTGSSQDRETEQQGPLGGCAGEAQEEVFSILGIFEAIEDDFDRYYDLFISDSRIIATTTQWQTCMAEAGFMFDSEDDMYGHIIVQLEQIMSDETNFGEFDGEALSAAGSFFGDGFRPPLVPEAQAAVDAVGEEEKRIAIANWICREPIIDIELAVQREYESRFVDEVGPQVRAIRGDG